MVGDLLKFGVNVNADPHSGGSANLYMPRTALQLAVSKGDVVLIHTLIEKRADVNAAAAHNAGVTVLQLAAAEGYIGLAKLLIEKGADINAKGARWGGRTTLEIAADHGRIDMLEFLLRQQGVLTEGDYRRQYIRAIKLAERNGHNAAAHIPRQFRCWTGEDSIVCLKYDADDNLRGDSEMDDWEEDDCEGLYNVSRKRRPLQRTRSVTINLMGNV
jgi:ankyrin repeat protein